MKNCYKRLISLLFVAVLCVSLSASAFAEPAWLTRAKAGIAAFMFASNLVIEPVNAQFSNVLADAIDPLGIVQTIGDTAWPSYLDQSVLQIRGNVVTIDGVQYSDILLGPDAAQALRLAGLDFASAYNLVNNQDVPITYAEGAGSIYGIPVYNVNSILTTPAFGPLPTSFSSSNFGDTHINSGINSGPYRWIDTTINGVTTISGNIGNQGLARNPIYIRYFRNGNTWVSAAGINPSPLSNLGFTYNSGVSSSGYISNPFSFDYTSGVIDAPLEDDDWLQIRVPTSFTDPGSGTGYDINDVLTDYPQLTDGKDINIDPQLNPDFQTDIDIGDTIGDLINTILNLLDLLPDGVDFNITKNVEPQPEPEPAPVPDPEDIPDVRPEPVDPETPGSIAETNWNFLSNLFRWIQSTIDNFRIATANALHNIYEILQDVFQSLESLPETVLQAIEEGPIKLFRKALDILKDIFGPIFLLLKNALGIWHYVVEWIASISGPFTWIIGIVTGTSSYIMLPIYASIAGVIVIAVYRRFGR